MRSFDTVGIDSPRKTPGWAFGQTTKSCPLEINTHAFNHGQQKNVEKVSQTLHFLLFYLFPAVVFRLPRQLDRRPRGSKEPSRFSQTAALQACQQVKIASEYDSLSIENVVCLFTVGGSVKLQFGAWADGLCSQRASGCHEHEVTKSENQLRSLQGV